MALTKTVTKMFPTGNDVGIKLIVTDDDRPDLGSGAQIVINCTIAWQYVSGEDMTNKVRDAIGEEAQDVIDSYKMLRARYNSTTYNTKVSQIDGALTL